MEQYSLLKLNGEYVKLYVTTNPNLPRLVKNSGSLVVYHDLYSDINLNNELSNEVYFPIEESINDNNKYFRIYNRSTENADYYSQKMSQEFSNTGITDNDGNEFSEEPFFTDGENYILNGFERINYHDFITNKSNYLYLGNELIAGGWGFLNKNQRDLAIKELLYLPQWCNDLQDSITLEQLRRKNQDYALDTKFIKYVKKGSNLGANWDNIDNHINPNGFLYLSLADFDSEQFYFENSERNITINNVSERVTISHDILQMWATSEEGSDEYKYKETTQFLLKDLPKLFNHADYEDIEISNIDFVLKLMFYKLTKNSTGNYTLEDNNKFNIENGTYTYYKIDRDDPNLIYVPIGSSLRYVNYSVNWITHESGGIKNLHTNKITSLVSTEGNFETQYQGNNLGISERGRDIHGNIINVQDLIYDSTKESDEVNVNFRINFESNDRSNLIRIVPETYNQRVDILKNVYFDIGQTPSLKYKDYPYLQNTLVSNILKSTQNIIKPYRYNIDPITIIPKYLVYFSKLQSFDINESDLSKLNIDFSLEKENNLKLNNYQIILDNEISIALNFGNNGLQYKLFVFALPTIYDIDKITLKRGNVSKNITGLFKYISYIKDYSLDPTNYNFEITDKFNLYFGVFTYHIQTNLNPREGENVEILTPLYTGEYELIISIKENNKNILTSNISSNKFITLNEEGEAMGILSIKDTKLLDLFNINVFEKYVQLIFNNDYESNHSISYNDNIFFQLLKKFNPTVEEESIAEIYHTKLEPLYI